MNGRIDTERILDAFLAPEADRLADRVIDAALADIARTPQRRAPRVPWGLPTISIPARLAAAVAAVIVIVVGGALYLLSPSNQGIAGPSPVATPSPTVPPSAPPSVPASPGPSQALTWKTFTAGHSPYRMDVPAGWVHSVPVDNLFEEAQFADRWDEPVLGTPYLVASVFYPAPESIEAWMERNVTRLVADCDASDPIEISIAGTTGERRSASCLAGQATEVVFFVIADHPITIESSAAPADAAAATQILDHVIETFVIDGGS
jgi:hypothetical protein